MLIRGGCSRSCRVTDCLSGGWSSKASPQQRRSSNGSMYLWPTCQLSRSQVASCCGTPTIEHSSTRSGLPGHLWMMALRPRCATCWCRRAPARLAAAGYGASEGLIKTTTLAEDTALGGQAGTSSRIENYLGFPAGLSGEELAARAALQAQNFGVRMKLGSRAIALS